MRVAVSADGSNLDSVMHPAFGRCLFFVLVDTGTMEFEAVANPAASARGGAGVEAARFVTERAVEAVITGRVGPKAARALRAAGTPVFLCPGGGVREAVHAFLDDELTRAEG